MFAIVTAYRTGLLKYQNWPRNIISGLIVGIVALPLAMAFAIASGASPEQGIYTAIVAALCVGVFGGSLVQIAGPTGAFIVILANITAQYGILGLQIATLLAGFILILMGLIKLGSIIKFIPDPVIVGFTSGIGVIIFVGEWKDFLGLPVSIPLDAHFHEKIWILLNALPQLNIGTTLLASLGLLLVVITPKILRKIPGPLLAMLVVTLIQFLYRFKGVATLGSTFGGIAQHLPPFEIPAMNVNQLLSLVGPAFTIALLGAIESLLSASAADSMTGDRHDSNQELIGQGIANVLTPLFGGFAATGAIARTATNIRNGSNSPIAAITHSGFLILVLVLLAPLAATIPLCVLAAILFVVAYNMSDIPNFVNMIKRAPRQDVVVLLTTFVLTIFTDLVVAVNIGVILAMLLFVRRVYQSVTVEQQTHDALHKELAHANFPNLSCDVLVYIIKGPFFFGVAEKIERALALTTVEPKTVIFRLGTVPFMDITGLETFHGLIEQYRKRGVTVFLCEANANVKHKLMAVNIGPMISGEHVYSSITDVFKQLSVATE